MPEVIPKIILDDPNLLIKRKSPKVTPSFTPSDIKTPVH